MRLKKGQTNKGSFSKGFTPWNRGTSKKRNCKECGNLVKSRNLKTQFCSRKCMFSNKEFINKGRGINK